MALRFCKLCKYIATSPGKNKSTLDCKHATNRNPKPNWYEELPNFKEKPSVLNVNNDCGNYSVRT